MAEVYESPKEVTPPSFSFMNINEYEAEVKRYKQEVENHLRGLGYNEPETGKTIKFSIADGYAVYMVASLKEPRLVHLDIGDAWHFEYAHLLGSKEIKEKLDQEEAFRKLFSKK